MSEPHDNPDSRPISVAELLARSGTIGAPPPGGKRRRRRGNADAVTVAELTGEIPIVRTGDIPVVDEDAHTDAVEVPPRTNGVREPIAEPHYGPQPHYGPEPHYDPGPHYDEAADLEPDYADYLESIRGPGPRVRVRAEQMRPDPVDEEETGSLAVEQPAAQPAVAEEDEEHEEDDDALPSYLRGEREHLFGGADDVVTEAPITERKVGAAAPGTPMEKALRAGWIVLQSIIAVAFGAGLFLGFDQLWKWNTVVALVLAVLVILGLVVAVKIVRKTEDIGSTLIAVAVGALVCFGPLVLLQST
jgi:hypothetical protein